MKKIGISVAVSVAVSVRKVEGLPDFDEIAPSDLTLSEIDGSVKLEWVINSVNAIGHKIERSSDGTTFTEIAESLTDNFTDETVQPDTKYYYRVRAYASENRYSEYSSVENITTEAEQPEPEAGYYFSENGNDANDGLTPTTAKKSLSEISGLDFTSIKKIFLKKGDEFEGSITINSSGTSGNPIVIDSYGEGDKPKIYGSDVITGWTQHSGNIYKATVTDFVSQVFADGERMKSARYPKEGYFTVSTINGTTEFTANALESESSDFYKGALLGIKNVMYFINFRNVTASTGKTLTVDSAISSLGAGKEFFLVNKLEFLTQTNEWYYDSTNELLYVWMPESDTPANYEIRATVRNRGVAIDNGKNFVSVKNLDITQFNQTGIYSYNSNDISVEYCNISQVQGYGISAALTGSRLNYSHNKIRDIFTAGIHINYGGDYEINHNEIEDIGLLESIGNVAALHTNVGTGILSLAGDINITYNKIINTGYCGIYWNTGLAHIYRNIIDKTCVVLNDGGGIYTYSQTSAIGSVIEENVILNTWGIPTFNENYRQGFGIYLDGGTQGIESKNNIIAMCGGGFNNNGGQNNIITGNLFFGCLVAYNSPSQSGANTIEYNKFYQTGGKDNFPTIATKNFKFINVSGDMLDEFDHNTYIAPYDETGVFRGQNENYANFTAWQGSGQDANSSYDGTNKTAGYNEAVVFNWTDANKSFYLNNASNLEDVFAEISIEDTFILTPYESKVLSGINSETVLDYADNTPPVITEFELPATSGSKTVSPISLKSTGDAVAYILTENNTEPSLQATGWSLKPSYTFTTNGEKTLYVWAKDAAGNISESENDTIAIISPYNVGVTDIMPTGFDFASERRAMQVTIPEAGNILSVTMYHGTQSGNLLFAIYSDNSNTPDSLLGVTAATATSGVKEWQTVNLITPVAVTTNQKVWIAWVYQNQTGLYYGSSPTHLRALSGQNYSSGMPASFSHSTIGSADMSLYCTVMPT